LNIAVFANPNAGRGRAIETARRIKDHLEQRGFNVRNAVQANPNDPTAFEGADALVVIGGDGTVHRVLGSVAGSDVPLYSVPTGTENLFAREFGMNRKRGTLDAALNFASNGSPAAGECCPVDLGTIGNLPFAIMASFGPDASVIHRLALTRKGTISHMSYIRPIWEEVRRPHLPELTVTADGEQVISKQKGLLIVANSRQYALRVDPAFRARVDDGKLDVVFFPAGNPVRAAAWLIASRFRIHLRNNRVRYFNASKITVTSDKPLSVQADGEAIPASEASQDGGRVWDLSVLPSAVRVLRPNGSENGARRGSGAA